MFDVDIKKKRLLVSPRGEKLGTFNLFEAKNIYNFSHCILISRENSHTTRDTSYQLICPDSSSIFSGE